MLLFPGRTCKLDDAGNKMCVSTSTKADASSSGWGLQEEAAQPWLECYHRGAVMGAKAPPPDPSSAWECSAAHESVLSMTAQRGCLFYYFMKLQLQKYYC